jgi:hypothetical protein
MNIHPLVPCLFVYIESAHQKNIENNWNKRERYVLLVKLIIKPIIQR